MHGAARAPAAEQRGERIVLPDQVLLVLRQLRWRTSMQASHVCWSMSAGCFPSISSPSTLTLPRYAGSSKMSLSTSPVKITAAVRLWLSCWVRALGEGPRDSGGRPAFGNCTYVRE